MNNDLAGASPVDRRVRRLVPERDTYGVGYGCACQSRDAKMCVWIRYGEDATDEPCVCLCHEWDDDDEH